MKKGEFPLNKEELELLYKRKNSKDIAKMLGCTHTAVLYHLHKHNIKIIHKYSEDIILHKKAKGFCVCGYYDRTKNRYVTEISTIFKEQFDKIIEIIKYGYNIKRIRKWKSRTSKFERIRYGIEIYGNHKFEINKLLDWLKKQNI